MSNPKALGILGIIIAIGFFIAIIYLIYSPKGVGVLVSCENNEIISIRNIPPPLQQMVQTEFCRVEITVTDLNNNLICEKHQGVFASERGIIECNGIKDFKGETVKINAKFFDTEDNLITEKNKELTVNP